MDLRPVFPRRRISSRGDRLHDARAGRRRTNQDAPPVFVGCGSGARGGNGTSVVSPAGRLQLAERGTMGGCGLLRFPDLGCQSLPVVEPAWRRRSRHGLGPKARARGCDGGCRSKRFRQGLGFVLSQGVENPGPVKAGTDRIWASRKKNVDPTDSLWERESALRPWKSDSAPSLLRI